MAGLHSNGKTARMPAEIVSAYQLLDLYQQAAWYSSLDTTTLWRAAAVMWDWSNVLNQGNLDTQIVQSAY